MGISEQYNAPQMPVFKKLGNLKIAMNVAETAAYFQSSLSTEWSSLTTQLSKSCTILSNQHSWSALDTDARWRQIVDVVCDANPDTFDAAARETLYGREPVTGFAKAFSNIFDADTVARTLEATETRALQDIRDMSRIRSSSAPSM